MKSAAKGGWTDLTRAFGPGAPGKGPHQGRNLPTITTTTEKRFTVGDENFLLHKQEVNFVTHSGTHLDALSHFLEGSETIDRIPLAALYGEGVVLEMSREESVPIAASEIKRCVPAVRTQDIVLIHTGWDEKFGSRRYDSHPYLTEEAAMWLAARRVKLVGIDTPTPELPRPAREAGFDYPVHRALLGKGVLVLENVANLCALAGRRVVVGVFPMKILGGDGAPARVVARLRSRAELNR